MQVPLIVQNNRFKCVILFFVLGLLAGCKKDDPFPRPVKEESSRVLYDWYKLIIRIQLNTSPAPIVIQNNRDLGYLGVGLYEAVQPGIKNSVSLSTKLYEMPWMPPTDARKEYLWGASANCYMAAMLRQFFPNLAAGHKSSIDSLENAYSLRFRSYTMDAVVDRSEGYGRNVATTIYKWSTTDNFSLSAVGYTPPVFPGSWVPTPPAFANAVGPFLANSRPFLASSLTATAPPIPVSYSVEPNSLFYKAAKEVYDIGKTLTADQKAIANHWADVGGVGVGYTAPGHNLAIITSILEKHELNLGEAAEVYAKTGIAFKDAFYRTWKVKFQHNLVRPVTYINKLIDGAWTTYLPTPPYPEYPSGLAGVCTPVFRILQRRFGDIPVSDNTYIWNGSAPRQYSSVSKMAQEASISRLYAGIHYRFTQDLTVEIGNKFGDEIANLDLTPPKKKTGD